MKTLFKNNFLKMLGLFTFVIFLIKVIVDADSGNSNIFIHIAHSIKYGDKIGHFLIFGLLSFLLNMIIKKNYLRFLPLGSVIIFIVAVMEEFSQKFFPQNRTFDYFDILADFMGIVFFSFIFILFFDNKNHNRE